MNRTQESAAVDANSPRIGKELGQRSNASRASMLLLPSRATLFEGLDAGFRSAIGAMMGLVALLGLDNVDSYRTFFATLVSTAIVSIVVLDPLVDRVKRSETAAQHTFQWHLLLRLILIAVLAVTAHELFAKGFDQLENRDFTNSQYMASGPFIFPILIGIFFLCSIVTLCWSLGMEFWGNRHRLATPLVAGSVAGITVALYFYARSLSSNTLLGYISWPAPQVLQLILAHVLLAVLLGVIGGLVLPASKAPLRILLMTIASASAILAWMLAVYWFFENLYEGLLDPHVFRYHFFVLIGWIVGLFVGPFGRTPNVKPTEAQQHA